MHFTDHIRLGAEEDMEQYDIFQKVPRNTTQLQSISQQTTYTTVEKKLHSQLCYLRLHSNSRTHLQMSTLI